MRFSLRYWFWRNFWTLTHRFNWHYMRVLGPLEDGRRQAWCEWCGLRDYVYDPKQALMEIRATGIISDAEQAVLRKNLGDQ